VLSYKIGYRKPNPLIFLSALKKAKTLPFNCVYVDDIPEFVYIARLMGIKAFQYKNFEKLISDFKKLQISSKPL
jgi:HAD superfamily hydrolase (TIGR01509 family)